MDLIIKTFSRRVPGTIQSKLEFRPKIWRVHYLVQFRISHITHMHAVSGVC